MRNLKCIIAFVSNIMTSASASVIVNVTSLVFILINKFIAPSQFIFDVSWKKMSKSKFNGVDPESVWNKKWNLYYSTSHVSGRQFTTSRPWPEESKYL